jgi:hypothetical protein
MASQAVVAIAATKGGRNLAKIAQALGVHSNQSVQLKALLQAADYA